MESNKGPSPPSFPTGQVVTLGSVPAKPGKPSVGGKGGTKLPPLHGVEVPERAHCTVSWRMPVDGHHGADLIGYKLYMLKYKPCSPSGPFVPDGEWRPRSRTLILTLIEWRP